MPNYIIRIPGQDDYYVDYPVDTNPSAPLWTNRINSAMRELRMTTPRCNPELLECTVVSLNSVKGKLIEKKIKSLKLQPPLARMTADEFHTEEKNLLDQLPIEFRSVVSNWAYERGHSADFEECLSHVSEYVDTMVPAFLAMHRRDNG